MPRPKLNSTGQKELDKAQEKFDKFEQDVKNLTMDAMNKAPVEETEPQTQLSSKELKNSKEIYLKPNRTIERPVDPKTGKRQEFNEKFRQEYEFKKQMVRFIAEHIEILGEPIPIWTGPYPGLPAEEWIVPVNKPVWGPRYLAEQIQRKSYHRLSMDNHAATGTDHAGTYVGSIVVDNTIHRLNAHPAPNDKILTNKMVSNF